MGPAWWHFHAKALQASSNTKLVAVAARNAEKREKIASEFGCKGYATLEEMLADPEVQVVNILTPNDAHYEPVLQCARAGKHVLVEKPPAVTLRETDGMIAACREAGVKRASCSSAACASRFRRCAPRSPKAASAASTMPMPS